MSNTVSVSDDEETPKDDNKINLSSFCVFGSTSSERKARWGAYRRLIDRCGKEYTSPQDRKRYKQIYSNKYGFASYMSQPMLAEGETPKYKNKVYEILPVLFWINYKKDIILF